MKSDENYTRRIVGLIVFLAILAISHTDLYAEKYLVINKETSGEGSLFLAIQSANSHQGLDTICFDTGVRDVIFTGTGLPEITESLVIFGPGADMLSIQPDGMDRALQTESFYNDSLFVYGLSFSGKENKGSCIFLEGGKTYFYNCKITGNENTYTNQGGGGIYIFGGSTWFYNCEISNNSSYVGGAGILTASGSQVFIYNCAIFNNSVVSASSDEWGGGGIYNAGDIIAENTTISGNSHPYRGGGIYNLLYDRNIRMNHVTITNNTANEGGGIYNRDKDENGTDTIWMKNTIIAGNSANLEANDLWGNYISEGNNLIQDSSGAIITGATDSDIYGVSPELQPLGYYSWETQHHPISSESSAVDQANQSDFLPYDQRGITRPFDGDSDGTSTADIGSFEYIVDDDSDGVPDDEEQGPDGTDEDYDGNDDGMPDKNQKNVTSLKTLGGDYYITINAPENSVLSRVKALTNELMQTKKSTSDYPFGFISFKVDSLHNTDSREVLVYLPEGLTSNGYINFGPTTDEHYPHLYNFIYNGEVGAEFEENRIVLHFIDGQTGDNDLTENSSLLVIGGPANVDSSEEEDEEDEETTIIPGEEVSISFFPNPFTTSINFIVPGVERNHTIVTIYNTEGKELKKMMFYNQDNNLLEVDCSDFPVGVYLYNISQGNSNYTGKIIKVAH